MRMQFAAQLLGRGHDRELAVRGVGRAVQGRRQGVATATMIIHMHGIPGMDRAGQDQGRQPEREARPRSPCPNRGPRSEEHTSELQALMRNSYAVFCLKKKNTL